MKFNYTVSKDDGLKNKHVILVEVVDRDEHHETVHLVFSTDKWKDMLLFQAYIKGLQEVCRLDTSFHYQVVDAFNVGFPDLTWKETEEMLLDEIGVDTSATPFMWILPIIKLFTLIAYDDVGNKYDVTIDEGE